MPEGPEIWRAADRLSDALTNDKIEIIAFNFDNLAKYGSVLTGTTVTSVEPRGKAIVTSFSNGLAMYSHNQLYGKWFVGERGERPDTNRSLRVEIHNSSHSAFLYSASDVQIMDRESIEEHSYIKKLGPDVLHPSVSREDVLARFKDESFQNRKITTLFLDQGFLSGIGNYLRSEILFYARANPAKKLKAFSSDMKKKMAHAALDLARRSYDTAGITNDPEIVEALRREGAGRSQYRHFVYNRTGDRCHKCGSIIEEDKTGGRKVYYCPECQLPEDG